MIRVAIVFLAVSIAVLPREGEAKMPCVPTQRLVDVVKGQGEEMRWHGEARRNVMILFVHPSTAAWTIIVASPMRIGCIVAHGDASVMVESMVPVASTVDSYE
jgi:hypothetical protein|tara:strand:- start:418 stop:726 length:309 start_codon:yes stop_codon:yes gene_type:complete